ncbi:hypothetical protein [Spirosoma spitsbergense]|uniref:hypothetical protein n=1 Tax=Spirosoma spitsbergense TaxID=431554 RepID=UPI000373EA31|nr:hypothetical protein [Spirosoma spitsbergense]
MNRRLFINQASAGCLLPFLPFSAFGQDNTQDKAVLDAHAFAQLATEIRQGVIGSVQQIAISHSYSPEVLTLEALARTAQHDVDACLAIAGLPSLTETQLLQWVSPAPLYGSCAAEVGTDAIKIVWQALARYGIQVQPIACQLRVLGSKGVLQSTTAGYQILDLTGRGRQPIFGAIRSAV